MMANPILLQKKYSRVVEQFSQQVSITREQALRFFYRSDLHKLMKDGVSDMHCMSDAYLVADLITEYKQYLTCQSPTKLQ